MVKPKLAIPLVLLALATGGCTDTEKSAADPAPSVSMTEPSGGAWGSGSASASPSPKPSPSPEPNFVDMEIGQGVTATGADFELSVAASKIVTSKSAGEFGEPPVHTYVGIGVQYLCQVGSCSYNPYDFTMRGSDGAEHDRAIVFSHSEFEPELHSGNVGPGIPAKGYVVYDLPPGRYWLEYRANLWDSQPASWIVNVS